jgi:hypothetical protein
MGYRCPKKMSDTHKETLPQGNTLVPKIVILKSSIIMYIYIQKDAKIPSTKITASSHSDADFVII